jgi:hypothetical protein
LPYSNTTFGNGYDNPLFQFYGVFGDNVVEMQIDAVRAHITQPENDDAGQFSPAGGQEISKIEVMGKKNAAVPAGFGQYLRIALPVKAFLVEVSYLMTKVLQKAHRLG